MSFSTTALVYEYFTGGGFPPAPLPDGLATEALGMLWAVLTDLRNWGCIRTTTAFDPRFENVVPGLTSKTLPADKVVRAIPVEREDIFLSLLNECDSALVIAPETDGILASLIAQIEAAGPALLGSSASSVLTAGNKAAFLCRSAKLPVPESRVSTFTSVTQDAIQTGFPLVIKPIDGVGSEGVCLVNDSSDLPAALALVRGVTNHEQILLQSFVDGVHASVSLLTAGEECLPISLNRQLVEPGKPFRYAGSQVPFSHREENAALDLACQAVSSIPGLNGYVGVDLVIAEDGPYLIEINPRITTSYIGLRQVAQTNLAKAIWEACRDGALPDSIPLAGQVVIRKNDPFSWGLRGIL